MSQDRQELLIDLLTAKAIYGLGEDEQAQLDSLGERGLDDELRALEITAAAINMAALSDEGPIPAHLYSKVAADAREYFAHVQAPVDVPAAVEPVMQPRPIVVEPERSAFGSWFGWLGWAAAAAACIALAVVWFRQQPAQVAVVPPPSVQTPDALTPAQQRQQLMSSSAGLVKAVWGAGNVKEMEKMSGDIVWSDQKQTGYMRFSGLPVNDARKETYQLWIFDKTQDKATPIDGGTFDVTSNGEVVIPIDAKLKAVDPTMFAITIEKPGGVVVSKREKVVALAKVETASS